jgi:hypothetical protein
VDIIPSFYGLQEIGLPEHSGGLPSSNISLRYGEVKREILPNDQDSFSGLYREYEVLVEHYEGGFATHRMYHNCMVVNVLGGQGDRCDYSLRVSDQKGFKLGNGSKVLLMCIEGNDARAVILGGLQQHKDDSTGTHFEWEFNGVNFQVFDDGSWRVVNKGKTDATGKRDPNADKDGAGTTVEVKANGDFVVATGNGKNSLSINHKDGGLTISTTDDVTIKTTNAKVQASQATVDATSIQLNGSLVSLGSNAVEPAVLGASLAMVLATAFGVIGPTLPTPYQQAAVAAAVTQLSTILSSSVTVAK